MLIISAGLPKSGSGWFFNLINNLLIEYGFNDVRELKKTFQLDDVLHHYNCNIEQLSKENISKLLPLIQKGFTFTIKTHCAPGKYIKDLQNTYPIKTLFILRDPRDIALSVFDHGMKQRNSGTGGSFTDILSFEDSITFSKKLYPIWKDWNEFPGSFDVKYEDLVESPVDVLTEIVDYLGLPPDNNTIKQVIEAIVPEKTTGLHFNVGEAYRYKKVWSPNQIKYANEALQEMIENMGYNK